MKTMSKVKLAYWCRLLASTVVEHIEVDVANAGGRDPSWTLVLKAGICVLNYLDNQLVACIANFGLPRNLCAIEYLRVRGEK